jgi:hypothetical protein
MPAYRAAYENLTGKKVVFEYLVYERSSELVMQRKCSHLPPLDKKEKEKENMRVNGALSAYYAAQVLPP